MTKKITLGDENKEFLAKITKLSGQIITLCDQCGICSGGCPMIAEMDLTPSEMMRKVQLGQEDVLEHKSLWLCAACFTCTVRCPRGLDLSKVAEALRQVRLRKGEDYIDIKELSDDELQKLPQIALVGAFRKFTS